MLDHLAPLGSRFTINLTLDLHEAAPCTVTAVLMPRKDGDPVGTRTIQFKGTLADLAAELPVKLPAAVGQLVAAGNNLDALAAELKAVEAEQRTAVAAAKAKKALPAPAAPAPKPVAVVPNADIVRTLKTVSLRDAKFKTALEKAGVAECNEALKHKKLSQEARNAILARRKAATASAPKPATAPAPKPAAKPATGKIPVPGDKQAELSLEAPAATEPAPPPFGDLDL